MLKNLALAAVTAGIFGVIGFACSSGPANLCTERNVVCEGALQCDPSDGVCKCGGRGGLVCPDGFTCDAVANTCQSTRCARVDCSGKPGTSCDVLDGVCKCGGTGGLVCGASEVCNPAARACTASLNCNQVACGRNQICEPATGKCLCGSKACAGGEACSVDGQGTKTCVADACSGVTCTGNTACDPADGYCKCNGVICLGGESCGCAAGSDGGCAETARVCRPSTACAGVACANGTTCDPVDGVCKCGGPGGPVCASTQICALGPPAQCQGGAQCSLPDGGPKTCAGGTSCDPEDGKCKCGGRGGQVCAPAGGADGGTGEAAQICVQNAIQQVCRRPCDIRNPDCPTGQYCFYDSSSATPGAYCATPTGMTAEEAGCTSPTTCFSSSPAPHSLHCNGLVLGQTGICRSYCDVAAGMGGCVQFPKAQTCEQIIGAPTGFGFCRPN